MSIPNDFSFSPIPDSRPPLPKSRPPAKPPTIAGKTHQVVSPDTPPPLPLSVPPSKAQRLKSAGKGNKESVEQMKDSACANTKANKNTPSSSSSSPSMSADDDTDRDRWLGKVAMILELVAKKEKIDVSSCQFLAQLKQSDESDYNSYLDEIEEIASEVMKTLDKFYEFDAAGREVLRALKPEGVKLLVDQEVQSYIKTIKTVPPTTAKLTTIAGKTHQVVSPETPPPLPLSAPPSKAPRLKSEEKENKASVEQMKDSACANTKAKINTPSSSSSSSSMSVDDDTESADDDTGSRWGNTMIRIIKRAANNEKIDSFTCQYLAQLKHNDESDYNSHLDDIEALAREVMETLDQYDEFNAAGREVLRALKPEGLKLHVDKEVQSYITTIKTTNPSALKKIIH